MELDHENIMKATDYFEDADRVYLVMDLMIDDLRNAINMSTGPFTEQYSKKIFHQMLSAVHYCHSLGIIHRDIKVENFLLDLEEDGETLIVKLTDFGLCKVTLPNEQV